MFAHHIFLLLPLLLSLLLLTHTTHASTLYGLSLNWSTIDIDDSVRLVQIDPYTFDVKGIGKFVPSVTKAWCSAMDTKNGIFYTIGAQGQKDDIVLLKGLSLKDGGVIKNFPLPFSASSSDNATMLCNVDSNSGDVFVTGAILRNTLMYDVLRVNVQTGAIQKVAEVPINDSLTPRDFSVFDPIRNILFIKADSERYGYSLLSVDVSSGKHVIQELQMSMVNMEYDPVTDKMYGVGNNYPIDHSFILVSFDPKTNNFTRVSILPYYNEDNEISALDVKGRTLTTFFGNSNRNLRYMVNIDIVSGKVLSSVEACYANCDWRACQVNCPYGIEYDA